jgi:hypothetical protein
LPDGLRTIVYTNSSGDQIRFFNKQISIHTNGQVKTLELKDIKSVDINPMFKRATERPYLILKTDSEDIEFLVDTHTEEFHDLPTIYGYIRRVVAVG